MTILEFEAWVSDHYEGLVSLAESVSGHSPEADDLLHNHIEAILDGRISLPAWPVEKLKVGAFARPLRDRFVKALAQSKEAPSRYSEADSPFFTTLADDELESSGNALPPEARDECVNLFNGLPIWMKKPMTLYIAGLQPVDVAKEMGVSRNDANRAISRARERIRKGLSASTQRWIGQNEKAYMDRWMKDRASSGAGAGTYTEGIVFQKSCDARLGGHHSTECQCGGVSIPSPVSYRRAG